MEEDPEFILPPISTSSIMSSSMVDYFQLAACDDLSESEESPSSSERFEISWGKKISCTKRESVSEAESVNTGRGGFDTDAEMAKSFVLSGWADVEDLDTFISLLDRRTVPSKQKLSAAEIMAFIDSKLQYMKEIQNENLVTPENAKEAKQTERMEPVHGQPISSENDGSFFLDCLLTQLAEMSEHSLAFNLQLANVLCSLAAYPQPILVASIFNTNSTDEFPHLIRVRFTAISFQLLWRFMGDVFDVLFFIYNLHEVLTDLKQRLDTATMSIEGLDVYVGRALRTLNGRAEKMERYSDGCTFRLSDSPRDDAFAPITSLLRNHPFANSGRRPHGIRYHSHKAVESEAAARDDAATKNIGACGNRNGQPMPIFGRNRMQQSVAVVTNIVR